MKTIASANHMTFRRLKEYCLDHLGAIKEYPFDETTAVYKVGNKIFALIDETSNPPRINLKCDPYYAQELREMYDNVIAGYHMNKKHWNTIICHEGVDESLLFGWIDDSYELVFASLTKKMQSFIRNS
ncbi:MAG: MmcQ/YjbR family DNA-binding protein [Sulfurospirillaceae bacterium]|nr:MmcQ/YjbR family DNA-binding protein [Sulfurospirillaceae bacterium]